MIREQGMKVNLSQIWVEYTFWACFSLARWLAVGFINVEILCFDNLGVDFDLASGDSWDMLLSLNDPEVVKRK